MSPEYRTAQVRTLIASIQTLGRPAHRLIDHFRPKFLLALTATPERTDGGDLLALCEENLVHRCDLVEGVKQNLLCRFRYFGVPDEVDYRNIPWRNSRFDEEELTRHVATQSRARNAYEQLLRRGAKSRTRTSGTFSSARMILGRTSDHSRPPLPQPSGGIAIDRIPRRPISSTKARSPASMSSIRDRLRQ